MSMTARKSGSATASAGASNTTAKAMPREQKRIASKGVAAAADVVGVERGDEQRRAGQAGNSASGESAIAASPATMATTKRQPDGARHERRELGRMQLRKLGSDEEVGEGGADNG